MGEREREHINLDGYRDEASLGGTRGGEHDKKYCMPIFSIKNYVFPLRDLKQLIVSKLSSSLT